MALIRELDYTSDVMQQTWKMLRQKANVPPDAVRISVNWKTGEISIEQPA